MWTINEDCSLNNYGIKVYYFSYTEEFCISCLMYNGGIQYLFFSKDGEVFNRYIYKYTNCRDIIGQSVLYSIYKMEYYTLTDIQCNENKYYISLFGNNIEEIEE